jgi:hypothetical protein
MFRRRFSISYLLPLAVLFISVGIDIHPIFSAKPAASAGAPAFLPIGPRRYPPAYFGDVRPPDNTSANSASH